jgi:hypothetical protein
MNDDLLKARRDPATWTPERAAIATSLADKHWADQAIADKLNEKYDMGVTAHEVRLKIDAVKSARRAPPRRP